MSHQAFHHRDSIFVANNFQKARFPSHDEQDVPTGSESDTTPKATRLTLANDARKGSESSSNAEMQRSLTEAIKRAPVKEAMTLVNTMANRQTSDSSRHKSRSNKGILSSLLQLYGAPDGFTGKLGEPSDDKENNDGANATSQRRSKSLLRRRTTNQSDVTELDEQDRAILEAEEKFAANKKRRASTIGRRRSVVLDADELVDIVKSKNKPPTDDNQKGALAKEYEVAAQVADSLARQNIILKLGKALMSFGAPSHRIEPQLAATARALKVEAQFVHLPGILVSSFGDAETRTSEVHFVKASGDLSLGALHNVHEVYRQLVHNELEVHEASAQLTRLLRHPPLYGLGLRVIYQAIASSVICMLAFKGSVMDALACAVFGSILKYLQLRVARNNAAYSNIFEISLAMIVAFISRALENTHIFCYQSVSGASIVAVLPGYVILCGALELASRNMISGSVRIVWALIYSTFVGFGIIVGSDVYFMLNPLVGKSTKEEGRQDTITLAGNFLSNVTWHNATQAWDGAITFLNATDVDASLLANKKGEVYCDRDPNAPWWQSSLSPYWAALLVPIYAINMCLTHLAPIRSRQFPVMIFIGIVGWIINKVGNKYIFNRSDVVSFLGAMAVGLLGNLYSRIFKGTAFTAMAPGVLFLVPTGIAAAGGLSEANTANNSADTASGGLLIGFRIVQVAIGVTVGLFFSSFLVYSVASRRNKGNAVFAF